MQAPLSKRAQHGDNLSDKEIVSHLIFHRLFFRLYSIPDEAGKGLKTYIAGVAEW